MFANLKIRTKFLLISFVAIFIGLTTIMLVTIGMIRAKANHEISAFKADTLEQKKQILKNYTDIVFEAVEAEYHRAKDLPSLQARYGPRLVSLVDVAHAAIKDALLKEQQGILSREEAQKQASEAIRMIRYDGGTGYFWINDTGQPVPSMVMHPTVPQLEGKVLDDPKFNCAFGRDENLFKAFVFATNGETAEGFVDYLWPKPTKDGLTTRQPKLSFVRRIPEWNWIIGTGIYVDDAVDEAITSIKTLVREMKYDGGTGYFWINTMDAPFPVMVMHPTAPQLEGKVLDDPKFNCAQGKDINLFVAFVDAVKESGEGFVDYLWPKPTKDGLTSKQPKISYVRSFQPLNWIIGTGIYVDDIEKMAELKQAATKKQVQQLILRSIIISLVVLVIVCFLLLLVVNRVTKPIIEAVGLAQALAEGDFTKKLVATSNDEVGILTKSLNSMVANLSSMIAGINESISTLTDSALSMTDISKSLSSNADEAGSKSNTVAAASEEMNSNMNSVAAAMEQASTNVDSVAAATEEMSNTIAEIAQEADNSYANSQKAVTLTRNSSEMVVELGSAAEEIGLVTETIAAISDKTNLLALNATIEAARAGEAGKGFAVVANEIKALASQTTEATSDIALKLKAIQRSSSTTIDGIAKITQAIELVNEGVSNISQAMEQQNNVTTDVASNISQASMGIKEITENISQTSQASAQISMEISEVNEVATAISNSSAMIHNTASELSELASNIRNKMVKFKIEKKTNKTL